MNLSGILVVANPNHLTAVADALNTLPGTEVHQQDASTGRMIVIHEAENINAEVEGLRQIKAVPHVVMAEMVYHYIADDEHEYDAIPAELMEQEQACSVPAYLNA